MRISIIGGAISAISGIGCEDDTVVWEGEKKNSGGLFGREADAGEVHENTPQENRPPAQPPAEEIPCNPQLYALKCREGYLLFCPNAGQVTRLAIGQIPENEFCIEGRIRECTEQGWRVKVTPDIRDKFKERKCGGIPEDPERDAGVETLPDTGRREPPDVPEAEPPPPPPPPPPDPEPEPEPEPQRPPEPCGEGIPQGASRCFATRIEQCHPAGWRPVLDCAPGRCTHPDGEDPVCEDLVEREICEPSQTTLFDENHFGGDGPGFWRTTVDRFTCGPVCNGVAGGFPVHQFDDRQMTTALFRVPPRADRILLSLAGERYTADAFIHLDLLEPRGIPAVPLCGNAEYEFNDLLHQGESIAADGLVELGIRAGRNCIGWRDLRFGGINEPCRGPEEDYDPAFCASYIPFRAILRACYTELEWVRRW